MSVHNNTFYNHLHMFETLFHFHINFCESGKASLNWCNTLCSREILKIKRA
uniref:Uncharacterized protein n=1 Tax=Anguilla anguilla TaxID=7936 RepID=A0A0E9TDG6_ANGAN